ncbi:MAG: hypothetical protein MZV65_31870 [Chromatiales bacterium]|nr:hypothetical protein [Chromatiales bacterium]
MESAVTRLRALLGAPEHAYGLVVLEIPAREIRVRIRPWYVVDGSQLPPYIGPYRIIIEDEIPGEAL